MMTRNTVNSSQNKISEEVFMIIVKLLIVVAILFWYGKLTIERNTEREAAQKVATVLENVVTFMSQEDYESAYGLLVTIEQGTQYDDQISSMLVTCSNRLFEELSAKVDDMLTDEEYIDAINLIENSPYGNELEREILQIKVQNMLCDNEIEKIAGSEEGNKTKLEQLKFLSRYVTDTYSAAYSELFISVSADYIEEILDNAGIKAAENDFIGAVELINNAILIVGDDNELNTAREEYKFRYKENVLEQIDSIYKKDGVAGVISMLETATYMMPDAEELVNELMTWKNRSSSLDLISIDPFYQSDYYNTSRGAREVYGTDNRGNHYTSYCGGGRDFYIEYYIADYDAYIFTATVYVTQYASGEYEDGSYYYNGAGVTIYGDDKVLYTLSDWGQKMEPKEISIDIKGVSYLKIVANSEYAMIGVGNPAIGW